MSRRLLLAAIVFSAAAPGFSGAQSREPDYNAIGPGHYLRAVTEDGHFVTLEDASRWEIDSRVRFRTMEWQVDEGIAVRRAAPDNGFRYEIDNIDRDNGVLAKYLGRP